MFYDHQVLTSREYGIATVWLVATLGAKSGLKKVNRKAIFEVNIPRACETVVTPALPLALRLQSNLLYGLSRVYDQQCTYVLADAQHVHSFLRRLLKTTKANETDLVESQLERRNQLELNDDPTFLPGLSIGTSPILGLTVDATTLSSQASSLLSAFSTLPDLQNITHGNEIIIPASTLRNRSMVIPVFSPGQGDEDENQSIQFGGLQDFSSSQSGAENPVLLESAFEVDAEGNISFPGGSSHTGDEQEGLVIPILRDRIIQERTSVIDRSLQPSHRLHSHPHLDSFHGQSQDTRPYTLQLRIKQPNVSYSNSQGHENQVESDNVIPAPAHQAKKRRLMVSDRVTELSSTTLRDWNRNYAQNMVQAKMQKSVVQARLHAKKNANHWLWDRGLASIGQDVNFLASHPFAAFWGNSWRDLLLGMRSRKRTRSHEEADSPSTSLERRVRPRTQLTRNDVIRDGLSDDIVIDHGDNDGLLTLEDDEIEIARAASSSVAGDPLQDLHRNMPWNILGPSSSLSAAQSITSASTLFGSSIFRSGARVTPSPLFRRGRTSATRLSRQSSLSILQAQSAQQNAAGVSFSNNNAEGFGFSMGRDSDTASRHSGNALGEDPDGDELFQQAASQIAANSQEMREFMEHESLRFLEFIAVKIEEQKLALAASSSTDVVVEGRNQGEELQDQSIALDTVIPPSTSTNIVAARALMHLLSLTTMNLLSVRQDEAFGGITIAII